MILTKKKTTSYIKNEVNYRSIKALNFSSISTFDENPSQFFNEFIMGIPRKRKPNMSLDIGTMADFYLLDCHMDEQEFEQKFDTQFCLMDGNKGSGQAFVLADVLFDITQRDADEEGTVTTSFEDRFKEAFESVQKLGKYSGKIWEKGLEDFEKTAKDYFQLKLKNLGKIVVDLFQINKAKKIIDSLRTDEFHSDFINQSSNNELEVLKKLVVEFEYMRWPCKMELDFAHISHRDKKIYRRDLKTAYDNESFEYSYTKWYYYLQNAFYHLGMEAFAKANGLEDYIVSPMDFLVLDTSLNNRRPLLYTTSEKQVLEGLYGFENKYGTHHKGVIQLIDEITWARDNNIWTISKTNYENKGIVQLKEI